MSSDPYATGIGRGILIALCLNLVAITMMLVAGGGALRFVGLVQLVYLIPIALYFRRRQQPQTIKGLIIIASITFLLNAACDVMLMPFKTA